MALGPRELVEELERVATVPRGSEERFSGYGVVGLPFKSGHILCLRRWPASSLGQAYTSVWHRNPEGRWTFIQDAPPQLACTRYFGSAVSKYLNYEINISWLGPWDFSVEVAGEYEMHWQVSLGKTLTTQISNALGSRVPGFLWRRPAFLKSLEYLGGLVMGSGHVGLTGRLPNGQRFITNPRYTWNITTTHASLRGQDLGEMGPLAEQAQLGDFWVPQQGRFFIGEAYLETFDQERHLAVYSQEG